SGQIVGHGTTVSLFNPDSGASSGGSEGQLVPTTVGGIALSVGPSVAVISGKTYTIGPGATPTTTVVNGKTISIGPSGVGTVTPTAPSTISSTTSSTKSSTTSSTKSSTTSST